MRNIFIESKIPSLLIIQMFTIKDKHLDLARWYTPGQEKDRQESLGQFLKLPP
jgi:hypothetical protein